MISSSDLTVLETLVPGGYDATKGVVFAQVHPSSECPDQAGWIMTLTDSNGGAIDDGGYLEAFTSASGLPEPGTATTTTGAAIFYNIESLGHEFLLRSGREARRGCLRNTGHRDRLHRPRLCHGGRLVGRHPGGSVGS